MTRYRGRSAESWRELIAAVSPDRTVPGGGPAAFEREVEDPPLAVFCQADPDAVPLLVHLLADGDWWVRHFAAGMLEQFGPAALAAVEPLVAMLDTSEHFLNRRQAADTLGAIGPDARAALPALRVLQADDEADEWAAAAISQIDR